MHSKWIKTDLHIHSFASNIDKENDYTGPEYNAVELIDTLVEKGIGLFSITDHNVINVKLYNEILSVVKEPRFESVINYLVGCELDIDDKKIHKDKIHLLAIFESKDIGNIASSIQLFVENQKLTIKEFFDIMHDNGLFKIILIPHFHNKKPGLPSSNEQIDKLNMLFFDAYEDSNNSSNISKSLSIYINEGYPDFPFVAFSDCHNINNYPGTNDEGVLKSVCSVLGSINEPFPSIKTAFEEPRLRISIDNVLLMRSSFVDLNRKITIIEEGTPCHLSNYLNTIIGPFGSGKSLFINKLLNGIEHVDSKYKNVVDSKKEYKVSIGEHKFNSLNEAYQQMTVDRIIFIKQNEDLFYADIITRDYIDDLAKRLQFPVPSLNNFQVSYDVPKFKNDIATLKNTYEKFSFSYSFNYSKAFDETEKKYLITSKYKEVNFDHIEMELKKHNIENQLLKGLMVFGLSLFSNTEIILLDSFKELIENKIIILSLISKQTKEFMKNLDTNIDVFNENSNIKVHKTTKNNVNTSLEDFYSAVITLDASIVLIDKSYNQQVFEKNKAEENKTIFDEYTIKCMYKCEDDYTSLKDNMFAKIDIGQSSLFSAIMKLISGRIKLKGKKEYIQIGSVIDIYFSMINSIFSSSKLTFDILFGSEKRSILKLSPGGRAQEMLKLAFVKIRNDLINNKSIIVVIDR